MTQIQVIFTVLAMEVTQLAEVLDEQGRRQTWVADRLGVSEATVSLWLSGKRPMPAERVAELAALLGVDEGMVA